MAEGNLTAGADRGFKPGLNCAQSVLTAFSDDFDVEPAAAARIAAGFGGGIGHLQKTCGAVTGAVMVLGLRCYDANDSSASKTLTYDKVREFISVFEKRYGTVSCSDLIGVDISTDAGLREARERNVFALKCAEYVRDACAILESLL